MKRGIVWVGLFVLPVVLAAVWIPAASVAFGVLLIALGGALARRPSTRADLARGALVAGVSGRSALGLFMFLPLGLVVVGVYFIANPFAKCAGGGAVGPAAPVEGGAARAEPEAPASATYAPASSTPSAPGPGQHRFRSRVLGGMCGVTYGLDPGPPRTTGTARNVDAPAEMASRLAVYTTGLLSVIAPRDWTCMGGVGADGSESVDVFPPGSKRPPGAFVPFAGQGVTAEEIPACQGCIAARACPLFPSAMKNWPGESCQTVAPSTERVARQSPSLVFFEDPPGVSGDGNPSGGPFPANGVIRYESGISAATCTMPEADHAVCTAVLNDFLAPRK